MAASKDDRLTREDWAKAGFDAFVESGLDAVVVEQVARRIGATKGSFYWHFTGRADLVSAVLALWRLETQGIVERLDAIDDPRQRLRKLFEAVLDRVSDARSEVDLLHRADEPVVAAALEEVSAQRVSFMADTFQRAGLTRAAAQDHALQTYAMWIGLIQLQAAMPTLVAPTERRRRRLIRSTLDLVDDLAHQRSATGSNP